MTQTHRIEGGQIDRTKELEFRWNNKSLSGYSGDTLASALLANGVQTQGGQKGQSILGIEGNQIARGIGNIQT